MDLSRLKLKIAELPQNPGVYVFRDGKKEIIYIGKATNLKSRVSSYFRDVKSWGLSPHKGDLVPEQFSRPIEEMIHQVADLSVQETESVLEALILEANLIKKHQPKYNVLGKDDKSFSYFVITKEEFPRVLILRETELDKITNSKLQISNQFGPYTSKKQMEIALKIIRKIFPFHSLATKTEKGCLDFQLGRCLGPYAGAISKEEYAKNIRGIRMILEGKKQGLMKALKKEMDAHAKKLEFEKAQETKQKIFALNHVQDIALIASEGSTFGKPKVEPSARLRIEAYDISNISGQQAVGSMVVFENVEMQNLASVQPNKKEYRKFKIKTVDGANDVAMMQEVLLRRFNNPWMQPDLILLDGGQGHVNMAAVILSELGFVIPIVGVAKGKTRKNLNFKFPPPAGGSNKFLMTKFSKEIKNILDNKNLIKSIMDEAHRFAINYHRKVRKNEFIA
jgi:excinuclease ABC subunit C